MVIPVHSDKKDYEIVLESGALENIGNYLHLDRKVLIVTDSGVPAEFSNKLAEHSYKAICVSVPAGERSKNMLQLQQLLQTMLEHGFTRGDCVAAVGGGVVGDLSGFAASCYMRGIDFYNIPTTLLAQVDSSIGGKTGIDFEGVKNLIGTFYQPKKVIIDPLTLKTLNERQLHEGLAEVIKMAATCDAELFEMIEQSINIRADLPEIIYRALLIKKNVVEIDPMEQGLRRVLNFGHTIGHAIESINEGKLLHGECIALGMLPMVRFDTRERLINVLSKYDLPTKIDHNPKQLLPFILHDKKKKSDSIITVFVDEIGSFRFCEMLPDEIINRLERVE